MMIGAKTGRRSHRSLVGIGSREQEAFEDLEMMEMISSVVVGSKCSNLDVDGESRVSKGGQDMSIVDVSKVASDVRIVEIFVIKYSLNVLAKICASLK
jgi:hypothetical protein